MKRIAELEFSIGGYGSEHKRIVINKVGFTFSRSHWVRIEEPDLKKGSLSAKEIDRLSTALESLGVFDWKKEYWNVHVDDGTQWNLKLRYNGNLKKHIFGSNAYPDQDPEIMDYSPVFKSFLEILDGVLGERTFVEDYD